MKILFKHDNCKISITFFINILHLVYHIRSQKTKKHNSNDYSIKPDVTLYRTLYIDWHLSLRFTQYYFLFQKEQTEMLEKNSFVRIKRQNKVSFFNSSRPIILPPSVSFIDHLSFILHHIVK